MSCQAQYEVEIEDVREQYVREAVELMNKELGINYRKEGNKYRIYLPKTDYSVYLSINKGTMKVDGDSSDRKKLSNYSGQLKQFYIGVVTRHEFPNTEIGYNQEKQMIELKIPEVN